MRFPNLLKPALTAAALLALGACAPQEPKPEVVRPVRTVVVAPESGNTLSFAGEVRPRYETRLAFRVPGQVLERRVDVGARVRAGDVIAVLDAKDLTLAEAAAAARLAQARSQAALAEAEFKRYAELRARNFISQAEYDRREAQVRQASEAEAAARAEHQRLAVQVGYAALVAPHAGVITGIEVEAGQVVAAGQPVARLARPEEKEIAFSVPEHLLQAVRRAERLEARLWARPDTVYRARLRELAPVADPATRTYPARLAILNEDTALALGMTAEVRVDTDAAGSIRVPLTALYHDRDHPAVWVVEGRPAAVRLVRVETGAVHGDSVEIAAGLEPGQTVVTAGVNLLAPGQKVRLMNASQLADAAR